MCTVTWLQNADGYEVFCNRDELKTRKPALPPAYAERNGVRYLAPIDLDGGGSWFGVNEFGVTLCLVNHYPHANLVAHLSDEIIPPLRAARGVSLDHETLSKLSAVVARKNTPLTPLKGGIDGKDFRSRGLLLTELMNCASTEVFEQRLRNEPLEQYRPFVLLAFEWRGGFRMAEWNGASLQARRLAHADLPVTSSSFATNEVIASRKASFAKLTPARAKRDRATLAQFHRSHIPERGAYSVCMHRHDAETVSFSHVRVTNTEAVFRYVSASPCTAAEPECLSLRLTQAASAESFSAK